MQPSQNDPMRRKATTTASGITVVQDLTSTDNVIEVTLGTNIQIDTGDTFYDQEEDDLND